MAPLPTLFRVGGAVAGSYSRTTPSLPSKIVFGARHGRKCRQRIPRHATGPRHGGPRLGHRSDVSEGILSAIAEAVSIDWDRGRPLIAEVALHLDATTARAVALGNTAGLMRGAAVHGTGGPIRVPVGEPVLGRLLNALGEPADLGPALPRDVERRPIHGPAPRLARHGGTLEVFHTGIKVIDLLAPLVKGGKAAVFGGAGVGKTVLIVELIRTTVERHAHANSNAFRTLLMASGSRTPL